MTKLILPLTFLLASFHSPHTVAEDVYCSGPVDNVLLWNRRGDVVLWINYNYPGWNIQCILNKFDHGLSPEICSTWYSLALTAKISGKDLAAFYTNVPTTECNISKMQWVQPEYVRIKSGS